MYEKKNQNHIEKVAIHFLGLEKKILFLDQFVNQKKFCCGIPASPAAYRDGINARSSTGQRGRHRLITRQRQQTIKKKK